MAERYVQLARYYDLMADEDLTQRELAFFDWAFESYGKGKGTHILDATCGTGRHVIPLVEKGYSVAANDLSREMLTVAKDKAARKCLDIRFTNLDMRNLTFEGEFDAVLTINSAFNYMLTDQDAALALGCFFRALRNGGILILDVNNFIRFMEDFKKVVEHDIEKDGVRIKRTSSHSIEDSVNCIFRHQENSEIAVGGRTDHVNEVHLLRMFNYHELKRLLGDAGFSQAMCYGSFEARQEAKKSARRLIFIAIK